MPYEFPNRALSPTAVLDPVEMSADLIKPAAKIAGRLNAHDFNGALMRALAPVDDAAFYRFYVTAEDVDAGYDSNVYPGTSGVLLSNDQAWHAVGESLTVTSNTAVLWIIGWVQYSWLDWPHGVSETEENGANVQFGIRVDGRVLEWSRTGQREEHMRTWAPIRPDEQWDEGSNNVYPGGGAQLNNPAVSLGPGMAAVRVGCHYPVSPGVHTVELVARRMVRAESKNPSFTSADSVYTYSSCLFTASIPTEPRSAAVAAGVAVDPVVTEQVFTAAALSTPLAALVTNYNAITGGMCARGAFTSAHLPSPILHLSFQSLGNFGQRQVNSVYPGFAVSGFSGVRYTPAPGVPATGWWEIEDGGGNTLRCYPDDDTGEVWDEDDGTLVIMGNVRVRFLGKASTVTNNSNHQDVAVVAIGYHDDFTGLDIILSETQAAINSCNPYPTNADGIQRNRDVDADVPVFYARKPDDTRIVGTPAYFFIAVCVMDMDGGGDNKTEMTYENCSLLVMQFRS